MMVVVIDFRATRRRHVALLSGADAARVFEKCPNEIADVARPCLALWHVGYDQDEEEDGGLKNQLDEFLAQDGSWIAAYTGGPIPRSLLPAECDRFVVRGDAGGNAAPIGTFKDAIEKVVSRWSETEGALAPEDLWTEWGGRDLVGNAKLIVMNALFSGCKPSANSMQVLREPYPWLDAAIESFHPGDIAALESIRRRLFEASAGVRPQPLKGERLTGVAVHIVTSGVVPVELFEVFGAAGATVDVESDHEYVFSRLADPQYHVLICDVDTIDSPTVPAALLLGSALDAGEVTVAWSKRGVGPQVRADLFWYGDDTLTPDGIQGLVAELSSVRLSRLQLLIHELSPQKPVAIAITRMAEAVALHGVAPESERAALLQAWSAFCEGAMVPLVRSLRGGFLTAAAASLFQELEDWVTLANSGDTVLALRGHVGPALLGSLLNALKDESAKF